MDMHLASPAVNAEAAVASHQPCPTSSPSRQLALIAQFGVLSSREDDLDVVLNGACRFAAEGVGVRFAKVLQYRTDEQAFVLQAGIGWQAHMVGRARFAADLGTAAGFAWLTGQPILADHLVADGRFRVPEALSEQGIHRTASVPIHGDNDEAFGVLEIGSAEAGEFTRHDVLFLRALANCVAGAIDRQVSRAIQEEQAALAEERGVLLRELQHRVRNDLQGISCAAVGKRPEQGGGCP